MKRLMDHRQGDMLGSISESCKESLGHGGAGEEEYHSDLDKRDSDHGSAFYRPPSGLPLAVPEEAVPPSTR